MAHSFIEAFPDELSAFRAYAASFPDRAILLLDTYDTLQGARNAAIVGCELRAAGHALAGVRLDSGDFAVLSRAVREILDDAGLQSTTIFASGGLDEYSIEELTAGAAPIAGFGVGTRLGVSADAPHMDVAYKLVSYDGRPTMKLSTGKVSWPGAKQVWRQAAREVFADHLGLADEPGGPGFEPLLTDVMKNGRRLDPAERLVDIQARARAQLAALPQAASRLRDPVPVEAEPTAALQALRSSLQRQEART
jgi:nicotinate phosphoribosyltransferase